jgi:hypothetical protein
VVTAVPHLTNVAQFEKPLGHGYFPDAVEAVPLIAAPLALDTLPTTVLYGRSYYRIPAPAVLDVMALWWPGSQYPRCTRQVSPLFDRQPGGLITGADFPRESIQRRVLRVLVNGQRVLQRTKTTAVDFEVLLPRTPGSVP